VPAGWAPPANMPPGAPVQPDTTAGLDAALSTANSVLAPSMAEPSMDVRGAKAPSSLPSGILSAFSNPSGNNFTSATAALQSGTRAGYGTGEGPPPTSQGPPMSQPPMSQAMTQATSAAQEQITQHAQQLMAQQQQQQQFQSTLLQFQQQQLLLQQMQQRQRHQQQLQQLEQLQTLQQALMHNGGSQNGQSGVARNCQCGRERFARAAAPDALDAREPGQLHVLGAAPVGRRQRHPPRL